MSEVKLKITADSTQAKAELMSWTEFLKGRMGPAMKEAMAAGASHGEAHKVAMQALSAEYRAYKATGVDANKSVADSTRKVADETKKAESSVGASLKQMKENWMALSAAAVGVYMVLKKAWNLAEMSAQYEEQKSALNNLAAQYGKTADEIISSVRTASRGMISMADAASVSAKALMMGLNPENVVNFMRIAEAASKMNLKTMEESFEGLVQGVATMQERTIHGVGIIVDAEKAYKDYAASINKTAGDIRDYEKQQALANAVTREGNELIRIQGDYGNSNADRMKRFTASMSNAALVVGDILLRAFAGLIWALQSVNMTFWYTIEMIPRSIEKLLRLGSILPFVGKGFEFLANKMKMVADIWQTLGDAAGDSGKEAYEAMTSAGEGASKAGSAFSKAGNDAETSDSVIKKLTNSFRKYGSVIENVGADKLKFSEQEFIETLKEEGKTLDELRAAFKRRLSTIEDVYGRQIAAAKKLKAAAEKSGADPEVIQAQAVQVVEMERQQAQARLAGWSAYYETVKNLQASSIDEQKKKAEELVALEASIAAQRQGYSSLVSQLEQKLMSESERHSARAMDLRSQYDFAMGLSGKEKINALTEYQKALAQNSDAVVENGRVIVSQEAAVQTALRGTKAAQEEIIAEQERLREAKAAEHAAAGEKIAKFGAELDAELKELDKIAEEEEKKLKEEEEK
mgnify:CR=1 FL=1